MKKKNSFFVNNVTCHFSHTKRQATLDKTLWQFHIQLPSTASDHPEENASNPTSVMAGFCMNQSVNREERQKSPG